MYGAFDGWRGLSPGWKEEVMGEINLMDAITAHIRWKIRLQNYFNGMSSETLDPVTLCRDDLCVLGRWLHGPGMRHFHECEAFHRLRSDHAEFHFISATVVKKVQENDHAGATRLMDKEYAHTSHRIVHALNELSRQVSAG